MRITVTAMFVVGLALAGFSGERTLAEGRVPAFSPDGKQVIFRRDNAEGASFLYRCTLSSGEIIPLAISGKKVIPSKSGRIFFLGEGLFPDFQELNPQNWQVEKEPLHKVLTGIPVETPEGDFIFPTDFSNPDKLCRLVIKTGKTSPETKISPQVIAISSDGRLEVIRHLSGSCANFEVRTATDHISLFRSDSQNGIGSHSPSFSPDGRYLVYVQAGIQPLADLFVLDLQEKRIAQLTLDQADNQSPSFSPDGGKIVFCALRDNRYQIFLMDFNSQKIAWSGTK